MSEQLRESLSAAVDGEADAFELRRVLDEAKHNEVLREQWHRYHIVRDFLREDADEYHPDLRNAIWQELNQDLDGEDSAPSLVLAESVAGDQHRSRWMGRILGTSVAVLVAGVVMFNGGLFEQSESTFVNSTQLAQGANLVPVMYQQATSLDQQRQNALMLHHIQQRAMNQVGVASFVKVMTYNANALPMSTEPAGEADTPAP